MPGLQSHLAEISFCARANESPVVFSHWQARCFDDTINQPAEASLLSDDPPVRMFAILDRRIGKRTLRKIQQALPLQPDWLAQFYRPRFCAEKL